MTDIDNARYGWYLLDGDSRLRDVHRAATTVGDALGPSYGPVVYRVAEWAGDDGFTGGHVIYCHDISSLLWRHACDCAEMVLERCGHVDERLSEVVRARRDWLAGEDVDMNVVASGAIRASAGMCDSVKNIAHLALAEDAHNAAMVQHASVIMAGVPKRVADSMLDRDVIGVVKEDGAWVADYDPREEASHSSEKKDDE